MSDGAFTGIVTIVFLAGAIIGHCSTYDTAHDNGYNEGVIDTRFAERCHVKGGQVLDGRCYGGAEEIQIDGR